MAARPAPFAAGGYAETRFVSAGAAGGDFADVRYAVDAAARTATVTMSRARYRNTISRRMTEEVERAFELAAADDRVRVIVLTGDGDHFSSGHDLGTPDGVAENRAVFKGAKDKGVGPRSLHPDRHRYDVASCLRLRECPKPTVAKVRGYCIYHGFGLTTACDVVFAADDAMVMPNFTEFFDLPYRIGSRRAKELLFKGAAFLSGREAAEWGLVSRSVPAADLDAEVAAYCAKVARMDPHQLRMVKSVCDLADSQQGYEAYTKAALSMWVNMAVGRPARPAGSKRLIPAEQAEAARAEMKARAKL